MPTTVVDGIILKGARAFPSSEACNTEYLSLMSSICIC